MQTLSDSWLLFRRYVAQAVAARTAVLIGMLQPAIYLILFGPLLQKAIGPAAPSGGSSWQFFVPGLLIQLALFSAGYAGFSLSPELRWGVLERMRVTPVSRLALLLGRVLRDVLLLVVQSIILVVVGVLLGLRLPVLGLLIALGFIALLAVGLASLSYALVLRLRNEYAFAPVLNTAIVPLVLLSGILLPMTFAPKWLDIISRCTPFRYIVDAMRAAFTGRYSGTHFMIGLGVAVAFAVVGVFVGAESFRRRNA
ncbi:MAG TPA: ABC transporter permease [Rugosimonospora sp.]|nr:ABC transporter permease [Rugosimonospora sp.]